MLVLPEAVCKQRFRCAPRCLSSLSLLWLAASCQVSFSKYLKKFALTHAHGRGSQGGELRRYSVGLPNISGFSTWRNQRSCLSVLGLARIARQLAQLSWIQTAKQSPLGKIPLVADTGLRPWPEVGATSPCPQAVFLAWCFTDSDKTWQAPSRKTFNKLSSSTQQPVIGLCLLYGLFFCNLEDIVDGAFILF